MFIFITFFIVVCIVIVISNNNDNDNDTFIDEEILALNEMEKELVKEGKYDKTSFEEENLEEDDYYYEDIK